MYIATKALYKINDLDKRVRIVCGGTGASKTISILQILIDKAQSKQDLLISIVSESHPHLRRGAMRDFLNIMKAHNYYNDTLWNRTDSIYTFETGTKIEFFAADQADKLRGSRRDILFLNEMNNLSQITFDELEIRTRQYVFGDFNPTSTFWFYDQLEGSEDVDFITLTYKDNEGLEQQIVDSIERRKITNPAWYRVYGLGLLGELQGQIITNWEQVPEVPKEAEVIGVGLDFGFTNDPSVGIEVSYADNTFYLRELFHATRLSNKDIAELLPKETLIVADSAEPKSIEEIQRLGLTIIPCAKGKGSVLQGLQLMQDQNIKITKDSVNVIKDFRNYMWKTDRSGKSLNIPHHDFSHSVDATRYLIAEHLNKKQMAYDSTDISFF